MYRQSGQDSPTHWTQYYIKHTIRFCHFFFFHCNILFVNLFFTPGPFCSTFFAHNSLFTCIQLLSTPNIPRLYISYILVTMPSQSWLMLPYALQSEAGNARSPLLCTHLEGAGPPFTNQRACKLSEHPLLMVRERSYSLVSCWAASISTILGKHSMIATRKIYLW